MTHNVIPFPVQHKHPEMTHSETSQTTDDGQPVTREEMIQLVLRYAYGTDWAQDPRTADKAGDD